MLEIAGAEVLAYETFGSYQGDWLAKVNYNGTDTMVPAQVAMLYKLNLVMFRMSMKTIRTIALCITDLKTTAKNAKK